MTHALTTNRALCDLYATALTDDALEANSLVLSTGALPVLGGTEDLLAEQPVFFWL